MGNTTLEVEKHGKFQVHIIFNKIPSVAAANSQRFCPQQIASILAMKVLTLGLKSRGLYPLACAVYIMGRPSFFSRHMLTMADSVRVNFAKPPM